MNHCSVARCRPPSRRGNGSLTDSRTGSLRGNRPRVAEEEHAARVEGDGKLRDPAGGTVRAPPTLATLALRRGLHRSYLAQGVRRGGGPVPYKAVPSTGIGRLESAPTPYTLPR